MFSRKWQHIKNQVFESAQCYYPRSRVPLRDLLVGTMHGFPAKEWFKSTGDRTRLSMLLSDSPYVSFLREADAYPHILEDDNALIGTSYFTMADSCRQRTGWYFDATTPHEICNWMRQYYKIYTSRIRGIPVDNAVGRGHSRKSSCPVVNRVYTSNLYEVYDGHHRLAVALAMGQESAEVVVRGTTTTFLQDELLRVNQTQGTELYQPVPVPEVQTWPLVRKCEDRLGMMCRFLSESDIAVKGSRVLDCACSYGWFVKQYKDLGASVTGIDRDATVLGLGQLIYGLAPSECRHDTLEAFLASTGDTFDIVLSLSILHHYAIGKEKSTPEGILRRLSAITGKVLFLDTGQSHESWFFKALPAWNAEFVRTLVLRNTSFRAVLPLGVDADNVGRYRDNYGRTLFACLK